MQRQNSTQCQARDPDPIFTPNRFFYTSHSDHGALSLTLIACASPIVWSFAPDNTTEPYLFTTTMDTFHVEAPSRGVYTLRLVSREKDSFVHVYVSTEEGGPQALQKAKLTKLRLLKRQKGKRLTVKWNPRYAWLSQVRIEVINMAKCSRLSDSN
jgi:hypothetical protein